MNAQRRSKHTVCKVGAAVRLHGYCAARIEAMEYERTGPDYSRGTWLAHCVVTEKEKSGPHGYRPGERVTVVAGHAVPRDLIRVSRQSGALTWPAFEIEVGA